MSCRYCLKCTKFCQLTLRKMIKIVATRRRILSKFDFGWGSAPDPAGELTAGFKGPTSKGRVGRRGGRGRKGEGEEGKRGGCPVFSLSRPGNPSRVMLCKRGLCRHAVSVRLSLCLSRSWIMSKRISISSTVFHRRVATPF